MAINKVIYGGETLIDLTGDTVTADKILSGFTAHDKAGEPITGTCEFDVNSQDATAAVAEILQGKTAYVRGQKLTGTMKNTTPYFFAIVTKCLRPSCGRCSGFRLSSSRIRLNTL